MKKEEERRSTGQKGRRSYEGGEKREGLERDKEF
jgi:hypothetical protein